MHDDKASFSQLWLGDERVNQALNAALNTADRAGRTIPVSGARYTNPEAAGPFALA